jgi:hypothetical protein
MSVERKMSEQEQKMLDGLREHFDKMSDGDYHILRAFTECAILKILPKSGWSFMGRYEYEVRSYAQGFGVVI